MPQAPNIYGLTDRNREQSSEMNTKIQNAFYFVKMVCVIQFNI